MNPLKLLIKTGYSLLGLRKAPDTPPPFKAQDVHNILVVRNDNLGDVLLTVPALRALRQAYPTACLAVLVNGYTRPALEETPWIDKIYSYDKFKHGKHQTRLHAWRQQYQLIQELQQANFDLAIGIRAAFSSSHGHLVYASAARWRLGPAPGEKKKNLAFFYNITVPKPIAEKHEVERSLDVVRTIGVDTTDKQLEFFIPKRYQEQIQEWLTQQKLDQPLLGIQLSQRTEEGRCWSTEKYVKLISALQQKQNYSLVLVYAPTDTPAAQRIQQTLREKITAFSSQELKLVAALLSRCKVLITLEGGAMHLAAAVGTPTVAVFGKSNQLVWHPWGKGHIVLKTGNQENMVEAEDILKVLHL